MAEAFTISNVNFSELGTRYTDSSPRASGQEIVNTPCPAVQYFPNSKSFQSKYSSSNILGDAVVVYTAQGYDYHRNTSVFATNGNIFHELPDTKS